MIAAIIPCYRVSHQVMEVLAGIEKIVDRIYLVDDGCPEGTGRYVQNNCSDPRVTVLFHEKNQGVGGATLTGFERARRDGAEILVKLDGDGQMDPRFIPSLIAPIVAGRADFTKGNRFHSTAHLRSMPKIRLLGNSVLSLISKFANGYWRSMDPTNGYLAIHGRVLAALPVAKLDRRYFFESDLLFRLNVLRAVVWDVPLAAHYANEPSSLSTFRALGEFPLKHMRCFVKRLLYNYYVRDFNIASLQLIGGLLLLAGGAVTLRALPSILGFQLLLAAAQYDISNEPARPLHPMLDVASANREAQHSAAA